MQNSPSGELLAWSRQCRITAAQHRAGMTAQGSCQASDTSPMLRRRVPGVQEVDLPMWTLTSPIVGGGDLWKGGEGNYESGVCSQRKA